MVGAREADTTLLLLRYDGSFSVAMTGSSDDSDKQLAFEDVAGTEGALWVLATRRPWAKTPGSVLFRYDGTTWHTIELSGVDGVQVRGEPRRPAVGAGFRHLRSSADHRAADD